jgi:protocatechuate 3,4-dioxygenase beta subunit
MTHRRLSRREMIELCITRGSLLTAVAAMSQNSLLEAWQRAERGALSPTSADLLGPFYKKNAPNVRVLRRPGEPGLPLRVVGTVRTSRDEILSNATLEVWQTDFKGRYDIEGDRYRAEIRPSDDGAYWIETIMPGRYDDRPVRHIHYLVSAPGYKTVVTQAYFATDTFFGGNPDANYAKDGWVQHRELVRPVTLSERDGISFAAITFDFVLEKA